MKCNHGIRAKAKDDSWTDLENQSALVAVKESLNMVRDRKDEIELLIDRIGCTLSQLNAQGINIGPQKKLLDLHQASWEDSQGEAPAIALRIAPFVKAQAVKTRCDVQNYETRIRKFLSDAESGSFRFYATGVERALEVLAAINNSYEKEEMSCRNMTHLANMFECSTDVITSINLLASVGDMLNSYHRLWTCADECESYIKEARSLVWDDLNADGLEENARLILTKVKQQPAGIKESDAYHGLEQTAKQTLPTAVD